MHGTLTVTNSRLSGNSGHTYYGDGGGAMLFYSGSATLKNTIVANSPLGGNCFVVSGPTSQGHNLSDDNEAAFAVLEGVATAEAVDNVGDYLMMPVSTKLAGTRLPSLKCHRTRYTEPGTPPLFPPGNVFDS